MRLCLSLAVSVEESVAVSVEESVAIPMQKLILCEEQIHPVL
jgi:hypothetical protein